MLPRLELPEKESSPLPGRSTLDHLFDREPMTWSFRTDASMDEGLAIRYVLVQIMELYVHPDDRWEVLSWLRLRFGLDP